jgi:hypothetical protein
VGRLTASIDATNKPTTYELPSQSAAFAAGVERRGTQIGPRLQGRGRRRHAGDARPRHEVRFFDPPRGGAFADDRARPISATLAVDLDHEDPSGSGTHRYRGRPA